MKLFTRSLSMILSFQLLVGCNQVSLSDKSVALPKADLDFVEISGSVARAMNNLSNFIIPSAMATEGELTVYDVTDPNDPIEVHSEFISDSSFSIKVKKELVKDRPLKISFESFEEESKSREMIVPASAEPEKISAKLNIDSTIKSKITDHQIKIELEDETVNLEDSKTKLAELTKISYDVELEIIGNKQAVLSLLFHSAEVAKETANYLAYYRIGLEKKNQDIIKKSQDVVKALAIKFGFLKEVKENPYLVKVEEIAKIDVKGYKSYDDGAKVILDQVNKIAQNVLEVMKKEGHDEKSEFWSEVNKKIDELESAKLEELKKLFGSNSKYADQINKISEIDLGKIGSLDEGTKFILDNVSKIQSEVEGLMKKDGLSEKDSEWTSTLEEIKIAFESKLNELNAMFSKGESQVKGDSQQKGGEQGKAQQKT